MKNIEMASTTIFEDQNEMNSYHDQTRKLDDAEKGTFSNEAESDGLESSSETTRTATQAVLTVIRSYSGKLKQLCSKNGSPNLAACHDLGDEDGWPRKLQDIPRGYPKLAAFLDSDDCFPIYRRFGFLNSRILLNKQDELRAMEEELIILDEEDELNDPVALRSRSMDLKGKSERQGLLSRIEKAFSEYVQILVLSRDLRAFNRPSARDHESVKTFLQNYEPLGANEKQVFYNREDLITLRPGREYAWLDRVIEKLLRSIKWDFIKRRFHSKESLHKTTENEVYFARSRIDKLAALLITITILILMVLPVFILFELGAIYGVSAASPKAIGVLLVFTLLFSAVLSLFTKARRHEILGASAAYCAVLVVFIGNFGGSSPGGKGPK